MDLNLYIGVRLRMLRKSRHVSHEDLAEAAGVSRQQVQKYEAGINRVSAATLYLMAERLQAPMTYFFEGLQRPDDVAPAEPVVHATGRTTDV